MEEYVSRHIPFGEYVVPVVAVITFFCTAIIAVMGVVSLFRRGKGGEKAEGEPAREKPRAAPNVQPREVTRPAPRPRPRWGLFVGGTACLVVMVWSLWTLGRPLFEPKPKNGGGDGELPRRVTTSNGLEFVLIDAGTYRIGADPGPGVRDGEGRRTVHIERPIYMMAQEMPQAPFEALMGANPSHVKGARLPVGGVTFRQAELCAARQSALPEEKAAGRVYRLPREAEWEVAARAGDESAAFPFAGPVKDGANVDDPAGPKPVGTYRANAWGLYDMAGNVREWCSDRFAEGKEGRVLRGGSWNQVERFARMHARDRAAPEAEHDDVGLRLVFDAP
jgi:hypothetical protein